MQQDAVSQKEQVHNAAHLALRSRETSYWEFNPTTLDRLTKR